MSSNLDKRLAVWLNAYRDTKYLYDELTARTADKWLDEYPEDKKDLDAMRLNLRDNLFFSSWYLQNIFGNIRGQIELEKRREEAEHE